ncbi:MAG: DNA repair protein RecO [Candidatus Nomurabacteria bacterium]|jgi:DNA repair protein RecO (recombination protein O)|nr:DNA repair protein RecO [Candidatus Nomurabacteria bacterium]
MDYKGLALVLKRTNYGEADRIVHFLTPEGDIGALAKGVRKEKSRLAGGIEPFCLCEIVVRMGKGELGTLTFARLQQFYGGILADYDKLQLGYEALKMVNKATFGISDGSFFDILRQVLEGVDSGGDLTMVRAWLYLNMAKTSGAEPNLRMDSHGMKLIEDGKYEFDVEHEVLVPMASGVIGAEHIKLARLMLVGKLKMVLKVKVGADIAEQVLQFANKLARI